MTLLRYIVLLLLPVFAQAEEWNMITIRNLYSKAAESKDDADNFKTALNAIQNPNTCIKGYIAASYMIDAKHLYNPYNKLSSFNKGKALLESALISEPDNTELRFLRICVQVNTPSFLGYNSQIDADKKIILAKYASLTDADLKKRIRDFMIQSGLCTEQEKLIFNP